MRRRQTWIPAALAAGGLLGVLLWLGPDPTPRGKPAAAPLARPGDALRSRLAVVIDDVGYELEPVHRLIEMSEALTFAVVPHQRSSRQAAELAHQRGREVLVHLPMEPVEYPRHQPGEGALLASMDAPELQHTLCLALEAVPHARGLSNHMGSRLTADPAAMKLVMEELGRRGFYFLDSRTGASSVALGAARSARVPYVERHVFLDGQRDPVAIARQLRRAVERAQREGTAVAIGHPYPATLEVLRRELPRLPAQGVSLVHASELAS